MNALVTGGSGFIGSALVRALIYRDDYNVCNVDKLTYASDPLSLESVQRSEKYEFHKIDICEQHSLETLFHKFKPQVVFHFGCAESHVDRSI
ncbi:MAG: GDP-mannose 4,6-dehydratase [Bdellovibrionota bacterium]